ncbi:hypothetical protein NMY3_02961 [Candidatus Nitrosocosmicus oleophilus]|jgi:hypothetical protein|uniref:Uncharacterized protein n=1 Tax=Candidatus Nitrosocosmicus oleophilus TaxID=1353260 RepID=A0A654M093_9ARCH|nr:hypothetical protein NMY3_02961 [Candidatus Nitrosocosmicus oleophilus]
MSNLFHKPIVSEPTVSMNGINTKNMEDEFLK